MRHSGKSFAIDTTLDLYCKRLYTYSAQIKGKNMSDAHSNDEGEKILPFTPPPGVCLGLPTPPVVVGDEDHSLYNREAWQDQNANG